MRRLPANAPCRNVTSSIFRAEGSRRPFRRGDLAIMKSSVSSSPAGSIVLICLSEDAGEGSNQELAFKSLRGFDGHASPESLCLLAGVDTQEYGPGYDELFQLIAGCA